MMMGMIGTPGLSRSSLESVSIVFVVTTGYGEIREIPPPPALNSLSGYYSGYEDAGPHRPPDDIRHTPALRRHSFARDSRHCARKGTSSKRMKGYQAQRSTIIISTR